MRGNVKKAVIAALAVAAVAVGGMGALHMPFARPALALLKGTCPMGNANGADVEQTRLETVRQMRGSTLSKARPALDEPFHDGRGPFKTVMRVRSR